MIISRAPQLRETLPFEECRTQGTEAERRTLEADSHRSSIQAIIRRKIRAGELRVVPMPGDKRRVRILPGTES